MEQYSYHEETGKITLEKKAVQNSENAGKSIYLMSLDEFLSHPRKLVRKNNFIHSMTPIQYCKIEKYRECVQGTMRVPKGNKGQVCIHNFGFYLSEQELYLVEESHFLMEYLNKMAEGTYEGYSFRQILLALFEELLQDEVLYLQKQEEHLAGLEEELLKKIPDYFYEMIMKYRKRFNIFHAYYEQLMNMGDVMQTSVNGGLSALHIRFHIFQISVILFKLFFRHGDIFNILRVLIQLLPVILLDLCDILCRIQKLCHAVRFQKLLQIRCLAVFIHIPDAGFHIVILFLFICFCLC